MNVYTFLDTNNDSLSIATPYTGSIELMISGTATTGINPALLGDPWVNSPSSMLTTPDDAIINHLTATVSAVDYLVDATFNGIVYSYKKAGVWYEINMGAEAPITNAPFTWKTTPFTWG